MTQRTSDAAPGPALTVPQAVARARALIDGRRHLLGITGPPGSGKTTLANAVVADLGTSAAAVPMDGFHLADVALSALGRLGRKGALDTFDGWGYVALLRRLRAADPAETVFAPGFERTLEQPLAGCIVVDVSTQLVVTEGNYLLVDETPWRSVRDLLDEVWFVESDPAVRHERLVARHVEFGKDPDFASEWVSKVDEPNARMVDATRARADVIVHL